MLPHCSDEAPTPPPSRANVLTPERDDVRRAEEYRARVRKGGRRKGLIIVYTGSGKGKTTAAIGLVTRAWGRGLRTGVVRFLKSPRSRTGEVRAAERMGIDWQSSGDGWTWTSKDLKATEALARAGWERARQAIVDGGYDLLVLDEFTYPLHYGWLPLSEVLDWLVEHKPPRLHLVITGRHAPEALLELADLVTEMREIKHPFRTQGIRAQPGIEF